MEMIKSADKPEEVAQEFLLERRTSKPSNVKLCSSCKRFVAGSNFWHHRQTCGASNSAFVRPCVMFLKLHDDEDFNRNILRRFRETEAGGICRTDPVIQQVGYRHYCLRRCHTSKMDEVRKNVMQEMRELARLLIQFRCVARITS